MTFIWQNSFKLDIFRYFINKLFKSSNIYIFMKKTEKQLLEEQNELLKGLVEGIKQIKEGKTSPF